MIVRLACIMLFFLATLTCFAQDQEPSIVTRDPALEPAPVDTSPGAIYSDAVRIFQGIPGIERSNGGRLWATWYGGGPTEGPKNFVMLNTSGDDGNTWSGLKLVIDPPGMVRAFDPCLWLDPTGRLWLFWAQAYGFWDGRAGVWAITTGNPDDADATWSAPRRLCHGIMMNKPTVLSTGEWLLPAALWNIEVNAHDKRYEHDMGSESGSNVICSRDQGATWSLLGQAQVPERRCDEHMIVERKDGSLWMLVRTSYGIGESVSTDRGKTWSPGKPSSIDHIPAARFFIRRLASGNLLLVKHAPPDGKTRSHLTAYLSEDDGATWRGGLLIDDRRGVSYPDATQAPDGTIYLIYDYSRHRAKLILMAAFNEQDILAPNKSSPRLNILVNQATGQAAPR
ncbi:MAG: exo-alpha-sialidase [Nitrospiraceae bacterium]|nr:exo-alpha-sialidase [Nitrospiraceae bacterium]